MLHIVFFFLVTTGSDWIQGPYLYKLYTTYGLTFQQIALLFLTGFLCGASVGTALGSVADSWQVKEKR
jgi:Na+/H+ antiporter NhaC